MKGTLVLLLGMIGSQLAASDLPRLRVEGDQILAGEKKIRLRGINWGWWNSKGTRYTEADMKQLSEWGANVLRLTFHYQDLLDSNGKWSEECVAKIDQVVEWAEKYRQYIAAAQESAQNQTEAIPQETVSN